MTIQAQQAAIKRILAARLRTQVEACVLAYLRGTK